MVADEKIVEFTGHPKCSWLKVTSVKMNGWGDGWMDGWLKGQTVGGIDGWMDGCTEGWMDI